MDLLVLIKLTYGDFEIHMGTSNMHFLMKKDHLSFHFENVLPLWR